MIKLIAFIFISKYRVIERKENTRKKRERRMETNELSSSGPPMPKALVLKVCHQRHYVEF